jgi:hypothetical protein
MDGCTSKEAQVGPAPASAAGKLYFKDLVRAQGLARTAKALNASPEEMVRFYSLAKKYMDESPSMGLVEVGQSSSGDFYDINKNRIGLTSSDPDIFAHEAGHAQRLHDSGSLYKGVLKGSKYLNALLNTATVPLSGAVGLSGLETETKKKVLNTLAGATAVSAIPNLAEEVAASTKALKNSTKKLESLIDLTPGMLMHTFHDLKGAATYGLSSYGIGKYGPKSEGGNSEKAQASLPKQLTAAPMHAAARPVAPVNSGKQDYIDAVRAKNLAPVGLKPAKDGPRGTSPGIRELMAALVAAPTSVSKV